MNLFQTYPQKLLKGFYQYTKVSFRVPFPGIIWEILSGFSRTSPRILFSSLRMDVQQKFFQRFFRYFSLKILLKIFSSNRPQKIWWGNALGIPLRIPAHKCVQQFLLGSIQKTQSSYRCSFRTSSKNIFDTFFLGAKSKNFATDSFKNLLYNIS